uniref:Uncharacterized protein n=1 Tax=Dromaius novaehollandiae TaxID=8790 RepID=A0A8C4JYF2_DRONO
LRQQTRSLEERPPACGGGSAEGPAVNVGRAAEQRHRVPRAREHTGTPGPSPELLLPHPSGPLSRRGRRERDVCVTRTTVTSRHQLEPEGLKPGERGATGADLQSEIAQAAAALVSERLQEKAEK